MDRQVSWAVLEDFLASSSQTGILGTPNQAPLGSSGHLSRMPGLVLQAVGRYGAPKKWPDLVGN